VRSVEHEPGARPLVSSYCATVSFKPPGARTMEASVAKAVELVQAARLEPRGMRKSPPPPRCGGPRVVEADERAEAVRAERRHVREEPLGAGIASSEHDL